MICVAIHGFGVKAKYIYHECQQAAGYQVVAINDMNYNTNFEHFSGIKIRHPEEIKEKKLTIDVLIDTTNMTDEMRKRYKESGVNQIVTVKEQPDSTLDFLERIDVFQKEFDTAIGREKTWKKIERRKKK